jgi:hypothetical protein
MKRSRLELATLPLLVTQVFKFLLTVDLSLLLPRAGCRHIRLHPSGDSSHLGKTRVRLLRRVDTDPTTLPFKLDYLQSLPFSASSLTYFLSLFLSLFGSAVSLNGLGLGGRKGDTFSLDSNCSRTQGGAGRTVHGAARFGTGPFTSRLAVT